MKMKLWLTIGLLFLAAGCSPFWGPRAAIGGTWYQCDDLSVRIRADQPPSATISWGANTSAQEYADLGNWCTARPLPRPPINAGEIFVRLDPVLNYPYVDLGYTTTTDPDAPTAPTAKDLKVAKAYQFMADVARAKNEACQIGDYTLSQENVDDIVEAIATNTDRKYIVFNHITGYHEVLARTAAQAATLYTGCVTAENAAVDRFDTLITDITACTGTVEEVRACLDLLAWQEYINTEPSTQP